MAAAGVYYTETYPDREPRLEDYDPMSAESVMMRRSALRSLFDINLEKLGEEFEIVKLDPIQRYRADVVLSEFTKFIDIVTDFQSDLFQAAMHFSSIEFYLHRIIENAEDEFELYNIHSGINRLIQNANTMINLRRDWSNNRGLSEPILNHLSNTMFYLPNRLQRTIYFSGVEGLRNLEV